MCPFHHEKTPSFIISSEKQIFHCFGCGKGGNVFHFIMEQEKLSFPEAVKFVGRKVGIQVEDEHKRKSSNLYSILEQVNSLFNKFLYSSHGKRAHQYLINRGLKEKTLKEFALGYAPTSEIQLQEINNMKLPLNLLEKAEILSKREKKTYPYFRRRIIFPIFNTQGKIIAFGGRSLPATTSMAGRDSSLPKYLNSPETEIFEKGKILYGWNSTRKNIITEKKAIIVEGYMDLISLYEAGIRNVVASLGTSLTRWQIRILSRYIENVYIIYDSDLAGEMASLRSLELLIEEGLNPLIVTLPRSEDPDSYIRKYGREKFNARLKESQNIVEFCLNYLKRQHNPKTIEGKVNISKIILPIIDKVPSSLRKNEYIKILAEKLSTNENILLEEMAKKKRFEIRTETESAVSFPTQEELILLFMMEAKNLRETIKEEEIEDFQNNNYKVIARQIYSKMEEKRIKPSSVLNFLSTDARETLSKIMAKEFHCKNPHQVFIHWRRENIKRKITNGNLTLDEKQEQIERLQKLM